MRKEVMIAILRAAKGARMRVTRSVVLVLGILLAACGGDADTDADGEAAPPAAEITTEETTGPGADCVQTDELTAVDNEWEPECIVTSGALTVTNDGKAPHTFTITGSVDVALDPGKSEVEDVTDAVEPAGETYFLCTIHPGMDGFLWVQ